MQLDEAISALLQGGMIVPFLSIAICSLALAHASEIRVVHFNIKELTSQKVQNPGHQLKAVKTVLQDMDFDILSIQEMQYDLPGVPVPSLTTRGKNMQLLLDFIQLQQRDWAISFSPANTGLNAKRGPDGQYFSDPGDPVAREHADLVNFGIFPAQYSSGLASGYRKIREVVIADLPWRDFNPRAGIGQFKNAKGGALPKDMPLFDKNFTDVTLDIDGREVHLISLHTVPAFHFGNKHTPNYQRNRDQLRFLEWYLTGETDIPVNLPQFESIAGKPFIAMGDWNEDYRQNSASATVLQRLFSKGVQRWMASPPPTYQSHGYALNPLEKTLDYIVFSQHFSALDSGVYGSNAQRKELGCQGETPPADAPGRVVVSYRKKGKTCYASVHREHATAKQASDHFAPFVTLKTL